jgi:2-desacetyl-2-hydroxyethyl bacteriochlorophyllide A dehydrogenase
MNAAIFKYPGQIEMQDLSLPKPEPNEALIRVGLSGVCGTDFHIFHGKAPAKPPVVLGHEYCGEIVELGKNVNSFHIGDKVAVNPNLHCGYCEFCRKGKINLCSNLIAFGVTCNGGFAEYSAVPISQSYLLPDYINYKLASFAEPLSCCVHGLNQAEIGLNDSVAIIGAGAIGLLMLQLVKLKGAKEIIVIEPVPEKRKSALLLGASIVIDPFDEQFEEHHLEMCNGGTDVVIECAGNVPAVEAAFKIVRRGGRIIIFGLADSSSAINFNLQKFFHKEITVKSSLLNPYTFQTAVDLLISDKININHLSIEKIKLNQEGITRLFFQKRDDSIMKFMIEP